MMTCQKCGKNIKRIKPESIGIILIISIFPYLIFFGINLVSLIYSLFFLGFGLSLLVKKPSKTFVCAECLSSGDKRLVSNKDKKENTNK